MFQDSFTSYADQYQCHGMRRCDNRIDLNEQRSMVAEDRWREHTVWCERHYEQTRLSVQNRRIALKILVSEAFRRDRDYAAKTGGDIDAVRRKWRDIGSDMMEEMNFQDNSATVLRKLSSMSVFIAGNVCHTYGENSEGRCRRLEHQYCVLRQLEEGGTLFRDSQ